MSFPHSGILFDCDGVLVDSEVVGLEDSVAFLADNGFDWTTEELVRRFTGMRNDLFAAGMRDAYAEVLGRAPREEEFAALMAGVYEARASGRHAMTLVPGAKAVVEAARALPGTRVAVASSSAQHFLDDKVDRYGLRPSFGRDVYSADHVERGKPAPDIFVYAAERIGVPPDRCLVIEDSAHGVTAGVAAGCTVWGFTGGGHCLGDHAARLEAAGATRVVSDHANLLAILTGR